MPRADTPRRSLSSYNQFVQQPGDPTASDSALWLTGVERPDLATPEWVDCDSEFVEAIEQAGLEALAAEAGKRWTWHHDYMSKLPDVERATLVALCERHVCQRLTWLEAARFLHLTLGEPPSPEEMYGGYDDDNCGCEDEDLGYEPEQDQDCHGSADCDCDDEGLGCEPEEDQDPYREFDPTDAEPDMGYLEDYDEDDTNWETEEDQDENDDSLSLYTDDENDEEYEGEED
jgi:hypothetical protein